MLAIDKAIILLLIIFLQSCANISAPVGGKKDILPPKLVKSIPPQNGLNYNNRTLQFIFNERIDIKDLEEQLIVNPVPKGPYTASVNKNLVKLTFEKDLEKNTTYTLNFREGIKDVTEGNFQNNLQMAFSTGADLDTATISGTVFNYINNTTVENAIVGLYHPMDTLTIYNNPGVYSTKTMADGSFNLTNIKPDNYTAYALLDKNKNQFYDKNEEIIAFQDSLIVGDSNVIRFNLVKTSIDTFKIVQKKAISTLESQITFNRGAYQITYDSKEGKTYAATSKTGKVLAVFYQGDKDSLRLTINAEDSLGNVIKENIYLTFQDTKRATKEIEPAPLTYDIYPQERTLTPSELNVKFQFSKPVLVDNKGLTIKQDSIITPLNKYQAMWNKELTELRLQGKLPFKDSLVITLPYGNFIGVLGDSNQFSKEIFINKEEQNYASLSGKVSTKRKNYTIELLNSQYEVVESYDNPTDFLFDYILPGTYFLRAYIDLNNNKRWDTNNLIKRIQPEPIYFYKTKFDLRANWEIRDLIFSF